MIKIDNLSFEELEEQIVKLEEPKFKTKQLFDWLHSKTVESYDEMTNISKNTRDKFMKYLEFTEASVELKLESKLDSTKKYVIMFEDSNVCETVYLKYKYGNTACISSQVGCKMGCSFCASTKNGFVRNLTAAEMLRQIYIIQKDIKEKINNVVIMGSGEPLDNYENIIDFLKIINDERGQNISMRKITLSTCGIVPRIYNLADKNLPITLAISLHAATQEKREEILPVAKKYKLSELMASCDYYLNKTGRRLTFEYIMIKGFNDSLIDAELLSKLLKNKLCNVNLIPCNYVKESKINSSTDLNIDNFKKTLLEHGVNATVRRELGSDIQAACGQLRNNFLRM
nr:23S rRNA (adenine(2503)-C(2))-methyltransferase RlmN [Sedimentibacter sp.]